MRQKVILTITLTGPDSTGIQDQAGYDECIIGELQESVKDLQILAADLGALFGLDVEIGTHRLAQTEEGALWETVAREG